MKQKIKAKNHGITKLNVTGWLESEEQAINAIGRSFEFHENFNLPEQVLRASHLIKYISMLIQSNSNVGQKREYIQEILLTLNHLIILFSIGKMGSSMKDEVTQHLEFEFDNLTDIFHSVNDSLFKTLKNINRPQKNENEKNPEDNELPTKAELKKIATEYLCQIFLIGSSLDPTLTTDTDSSKNKGNLYRFLIEIKPFFETKSGIDLGTDSFIGRNSFDARKAARKNLKKSK